MIPIRPLMGVEREYAFACSGPRARASDGAASLLLDTVSRTGRTLRDIEMPGVYLESGGRFYVDQGGHPEMSGPECTSPFDCVRSMLAGERILDRASRRLTAEFPDVGKVVLSRCGVDYSGRQTTWGAHESYLHRGDPSVLAEQLQPFLASRVITSGAGGLVPDPFEFRFTLSPRAHHIVKPVSGASTSGRGLVHTKDESLARGGWHRLHLINGEALCSQRGEALKLGSTALVVALVAAGVDLAAGMHLRSPVLALYAFSLDPRGRTPAPLREGGSATALDVQRHFLAGVVARLDTPGMPGWGLRVCELWRETLDRIELGPGAVARSLDWGIKFALYTDFLARRGLSFRQFASLRSAFSAQRPPLSPQEPDPLRSIMQGSAGRDFHPRLDSILRAAGLDRERLAAMSDARGKLEESDFRFGVIGDEGLFNSLDRKGVIDHRLPEIRRIGEAMETPPSGTRASVRGRWIRRLSDANDGSLCHWSCIYSPRTGRIIRMSDPFTRSADWIPLAEWGPGDPCVRGLPQVAEQSA